MPKVFVVEDDERLQEELCKLLELEGFEWLVCAGFEDVAGQILAAAPDCVVMDAMIPGGDGRMVCRILRRSSDIPVIMLTCLDSEFDQVTAMDLGADAYLTKPYRPALLMAHIRAALRRSAPDSRSVLTHRGVSLDLGSGEICCAGKCSRLTRNETRILAMLINSAGSTVTRQELMCELWESDAFVDDNTLTVNVNRLRKGLASIGAPDDFIVTRRGEGYLV